MLDARGIEILVGSKLAVASRRSSSAHLSFQHVTGVEERPHRRWDSPTRSYVEVPGVTEYRLSVLLSNGRRYVHEWEGETFDRAVVIGYEPVPEGV